MADVSDLLHFVRILAVCFDRDMGAVVRQWRYDDVLWTEVPGFYTYWLTDYPGLRPGAVARQMPGAVAGLHQGNTGWFDGLGPGNQGQTLAGYTGVFFASVRDLPHPSIDDFIIALNMWTDESGYNWRGFPDSNTESDADMPDA